MPAVLRFGDRPAGAVIGARGEDMFALDGVDSRDGIIGGGGIALLGERVKLKGLITPSLLLFFVGEQRAAGSIFSLSNSSSTEGTNGRLVGANGFSDEVMLGLPPNGVL